MEQEELSRRPISTDGQEPGDKCIADVRIKSFTAHPDHIYPGQTTTLSWECEIPENCSVGLLIDRMPIEPIGSKVVTVTSTRNFNIQAKSLGRFGVFLPGVTVAVNDQGCRVVPISESQIQPEVISKITERLQQDNRIYNLYPVRVEVTPRGIEINIACILSMPGVDPDLRLRIVLRPLILNGDLQVLLDTFEVNLEWPWWYEFTVVQIAQIRARVRDELHAALEIPLLNATQQMFERLIAQYLTRTQLIAAINFEQDVINVKICRRHLNMENT